MGSKDEAKKWGGARQGAGRPAKQPGVRRLALSVTVTDKHWAAVHLIAQQEGLSASQVLDGMIGCALGCEPYAALVESWNATHTLDETLQHLAQGRERIVPKAPRP